MLNISSVVELSAWGIKSSSCLAAMVLLDNDFVSISDNDKELQLQKASKLARLVAQCIPSDNPLDLSFFYGKTFGMSARLNSPCSLEGFYTPRRLFQMKNDGGKCLSNSPTWQDMKQAYDAAITKLSDVGTYDKKGGCSYLEDESNFPESIVLAPVYRWQHPEFDGLFDPVEFDE